MKLHAPKKSLSLKAKIVGFFFIITFFSSTVIGLYSYHKAKSSIEISVGNTTIAILNPIVNTIDTEKFDNLKTKADMESEYYKKLQLRLNDIKKATGLKYLYTMRKTDEGKYIYVVDGNSTNNKDYSALGEEEKDVSNPLILSFKGASTYELNHTEEWGNLISSYIPIKSKSGKVVGILGGDFDANNMYSELGKLKVNILIIIIAVILAGIVVGRIFSVILVRSINKLKKQAILIKDGDLTVKFDKISNDEIGILTQAFKDMVNNLSMVTREIKNNTQSVVSEIDDLHKSFNETSKARDEITEVITRIAEDASAHENSIKEVSSSMNQIFEQVKNSVTLANLVSNSSNEAASNTKQAMNVFEASIEKVITVNKTVEHTAAIIEELQSKSQEIKSFSEIVSDIAKQTNLLSLNASIEAAKAGEQGKGFSVVANEIKILAQQSNEASKQISNIANSMQNEISSAMTAIQNGVIEANDGVNSVTNVNTYLMQSEKSSSEAYTKIKNIIAAIDLIENACNSAVNKVYELSEISKDFSIASQRAAVSTEEQSATMHQINENVENIKQTTYKLNDVVNKFKIEK